MLSAQTLLRVWEVGAEQHPLDRALTVLAAAFPEVSPGDLAALSVGHRDACLMTIYERMFGPVLHGYAECSRCAERLEFATSVAAIRAGSYPDPAGPAPERSHDFVLDGCRIRFRLPNSLDLAAAAGCGDLAAGQDLLLQRCVLQAERDGRPVACAELPDAVLSGLSERMAASDPQAEVLLELRCPACEHQWPALFDIDAFLWAELAAAARRLVRDVHTLARAYGWSEADIVALSARRRQSYLEMVEP